jgi:glutathione peroxidase
MSLFPKAVACGALGLAAAALTCAVPAGGRPIYAQKENKSCVYCHVVAGADRNYRGIYYGKHDHSFASFDNEFEAKMAGVKPDTMGPDAAPTVADYPSYTVPPALNYTLKDIDGKPVNLGRYLGKVVLMVNVASKCGFTPQYKGLEALYEKYKDQGLVILGFPANDFGHQEPGDEKQIKEFCTSTYQVTFPMFSKIVVNGAADHHDGSEMPVAPLYQFLTGKGTDPDHSGPIGWIFTKFLVSRSGKVVGRFESKIKPDSQDVTEQIEKLLAEPASAFAQPSARVARN